VTGAGSWWVPTASTLAWAGDSWPSVRAVAVWAGAAEQGPGGPDTGGGGPGAHAEPGPQPAGGGAELSILVGAGGPAGVHPSQLGQPLAFQPVQQPPQPKDPLGPHRVGQAVQVLGGQLVDGRRQGGQPV
jgi:hypothetical protein